MSARAELAGDLAPEEAARMDSGCITRRERLEGNLYFALSCARDVRDAMARMSPFDGAHPLERLSYAAWIDSTKKHLRVLTLEFGAIVDDTLLNMLRAEKVIP